MVYRFHAGGGVCILAGVCGLAVLVIDSGGFVIWFLLVNCVCFCLGFLSGVIFLHWIRAREMFDWFS